MKTWCLLFWTSSKADFTGDIRQEKVVCSFDLQRESETHSGAVHYGDGCEVFGVCMKGKKYAMFEQQFFVFIEEYMDESSSQGDLWKTIVSQVYAEDKIDTLEQRIIISTIAYHVHDLMSVKVKEFKKDITSETSAVQSTSTSASASGSERFIESNVSLLRYGGFALHSMLLKRERNVSVLAESSTKIEIELLKSMKVTEEEWDAVPSAIKYLQQGGLDIISPKMLPFLRYVVEKTASLVNDKTCRE